MGSAGWEVDRVTWWKGAGETAGKFWQKVTGGSDEDVERGRKELTSLMSGKRSLAQVKERRGQGCYFIPRAI